MTTLRQVEANRRNAALSTGPKTDAGKDRSRRNAVKHGLLSQVVLPEEHQAAFETRLEGWKMSATVEGEILGFVLRQAVRASIQVEACQTEVDVRRIELTDIAHDPGPNWDNDRQDEANRLGESLSRNPVRVSLELKRTPKGRSWLIREWQMLLKVMPGNDCVYFWNDSHTQKALDLQGYPPRDLATMPELRNPYRDPWKTRALIEAEVAALESLQANSERENAELRELHQHGLRLESDRGLKLLRRYEASAQRVLARALPLIHKPHKTSAPKTSAPARSAPVKTHPLLVDALPEQEPAAQMTVESVTPEVPVPAAVPAKAPELKGNRRQRRQREANARREARRAKVAVSLSR